MKLLDTIRKDQLQARKDRNTVKKNLLTTLIGEVDLQASKKKGMDTLSLLKKFIKDLEHMIQVNPIHNEDHHTELEILKALLPPQMSEEAIETAIRESGATNMGEAMKFMKTGFPGLYDGRLASQIAKGIF